MEGNVFFRVQYGYILNSISCFCISDLVDGSIMLVLIVHTCELAIEIQRDVVKFGAVSQLRLCIYVGDPKETQKY